MPPEDPAWWNYMSMPKLKQNQVFGVGPVVYPDTKKLTKQAYKQMSKKVQRPREVVEKYDPIAQLHMPFKLQQGVSNFISDYDPDPFVQQQLLQTCTCL